MEENRLKTLLTSLVDSPQETSWIEFKQNFHNEDEIGICISALSNSACVENRDYAYLVYGIEDKTHQIKGTSFKPLDKKVGNEDLYNWLMQMLDPKINFSVHEFNYEGNHISIFIIPKSNNQSTYYKSNAYIRIKSQNRNLKDYPELQRKLWSDKSANYEDVVAIGRLSQEDVINYLDTQCIFDNYYKLGYPSNRTIVVDRLIQDSFIKLNDDHTYSILNKAAVLFAKNLNQFPNLVNKAVRVTQFKGTNKRDIVKDNLFDRGYLVDFENLLTYLQGLLPSNEEIERIFRRTITMYPVDCLRELIVNSIVHQDFFERGGPEIDIYSDRIEIISPGAPLIDIDRFIDENQTRNEKLADVVRNIGLCEEKGSGIDRVIDTCEIYQLPPPSFSTQQIHTKSIMYAHQELKSMSRVDKIRACYQHCSIKFLSNDKMTNKSLRKRLNINDKNSAIASRIIKETLDEKRIKLDDPSSSRKFAKYVPHWA